MNQKTLDRYKNIEYLCECSGGRLREIIRELISELEHYSGSYRYPEGMKSPEDAAYDIIAKPGGIAKIQHAIEQAIRDSVHQAVEATEKRLKRSPSCCC